MDEPAVATSFTCSRENVSADFRHLLCEVQKENGYNLCHRNIIMRNQAARGAMGYRISGWWACENQVESTGCDNDLIIDSVSVPSPLSCGTLFRLQSQQRQFIPPRKHHQSTSKETSEPRVLVFQSTCFSLITIH